MKFNIWLENREHEELRRILIDTLNLDPENMESALISSFDSKKLQQVIQSISKFNSLSDGIQMAILQKIDRQDGTIGDLITMIEHWPI